MRRTVSVALVLLVLAATAAVAMMGMGEDSGPDVWGGLVFKPVVGQWSEYLMTMEGQKPMTMRIAVVGKEDGAYWYESVVPGPRGERTVMKMLVSGDPQDETNIKRMIMKSGDNPAMEMPVQTMQNMDSGMAEMQAAMDQAMKEAAEEAGEEIPGQAEEEPEPASVDLGVETITVPAGTFKAHHWQFTDEETVTDMWLSTSVGPYGAVKTTSSDFEMVLVAHGDDAVSAITEEPQSMSIPGFKMPGMGGE